MTTSRKGTPMAIEITRKLEIIGQTVTEIRDRQLETDVHMKSIIGPPSLEDRMKRYVDDRKAHIDANSDQKLLQMQKILEMQNENTQLKLAAEIRETRTELMTVKTANDKTEVERRTNHDENGRRLAKIERKMYMAIGALAMLNVVAEFLFKVVFK